MLHIQMHHQRDAKKRIFLCILGIHTLCLTLSDFSSGLTVYWTRASESGIKWAVVIEAVGGGHRGRGRCRPSMSGVSWGLCVALVGVQSPREAWAALR